MIVESSTTLVLSGTLMAFKLRGVPCTPHKVVVHPSNASTLELTSLYVCGGRGCGCVCGYVCGCACVGVCVGVQETDRRTEEKSLQYNLDTSKATSYSFSELPST